MSSFGASLNCSTPPISQSTSPSPSSQSHSNAEVSSFTKQNWALSAHQPQLYLATLPTVTPANEAGSSKSLQFSRPKRKRITPEQLEVLSNLFEYTDTPTFDLREAIGSKLGMSNREVQVWFQNRRAKVNRQKIPSNTQVLQERSVPSPISQQQEPSPPSHGRMKSSPTHLLLPGVSSILNSDSCRANYSAPPLLPPFQATLPGVDSLQDGPVCISPQNPTSSDSFFRASAQMRPSPPGSRRRVPISTPTSFHSRRSPRCGSPVEDSTRPLSPVRSSADPPAGIIPDSLTPSLTASSHWNSASSHASWSLADSRSAPLTRHDYHPRSKPTPILTTPPHGWTQTPNEDPTPSVDNQVSYHSHRLSTSRCSSETFRFSQPLKGCAPSPPVPVLALPSQINHERDTARFESFESSQSLAAPQAPRPGLCEDSVPTTTRSLFASRCLPPLPNPNRPGPGSFPPPPALRVVPIKRDSSSTTLVRARPSSDSEFKLPPLLNGPSDY